VGETTFNLAAPIGSAAMELFANLPLTLALEMRINAIPMFLKLGTGAGSVGRGVGDRRAFGGEIHPPVGVIQCGRQGVAGRYCPLAGSPRARTHNQ